MIDLRSKPDCFFISFPSFFVNRSKYFLALLYTGNSFFATGLQKKWRKSVRIFSIWGIPLGTSRGLSVSRNRL